MHASVIFLNWCNNIGYDIFNRPGVAGAVLQSPPSLIDSVSDGLWKYIPNTVNPKPEELGS